MTAENQSFSAVQKLDASHEVDAFDCGKETLDRFLQRHALVNQKAGSAQTYVVCRREQRVAGYYSLAVGAVEHADAPVVQQHRNRHRDSPCQGAGSGAETVESGREIDHGSQ